MRPYLIDTATCRADRRYSTAAQEGTQVYDARPACDQIFGKNLNPSEDTLVTTEWKVEALELADSLASEFQQGPILDDRGTRLFQEQQVAILNGLKIEIFSNEHPPPHFRVLYAGETASYAIKDCSKLIGGLKKWDRTIRRWHAQHKAELIATWDRTRPTNCPVGPYRE